MTQTCCCGSDDAILMVRGSPSQESIPRLSSAADNNPRASASPSPALETCAAAANSGRSRDTDVTARVALKFKPAASVLQIQSSSAAPTPQTAHTQSSARARLIGSLVEEFSESSTSRCYFSGSAVINELCRAPSDI